MKQRWSGRERMLRLLAAVFLLLLAVTVSIGTVLAVAWLVQADSAVVLGRWFAAVGALTLAVYITGSVLDQAGR